MRTDSLVDRLTLDLRPVRPRSIKREALLLLLLAGVEIAAFLGMGFMRPDMPVAMGAPSFWWKLTSMGLIAVLGAGVAILSADPVRSPRRGLRWILVCIVVIFASGWLIDAAGNGLGGLVRRLDWTQGLRCVWKMVVLSIPPAVALGRANTPRGPNRSIRDGACRWTLLGRLGSIRLCLCLPLRRSALHRGLVHSRMLDRHLVGACNFNAVVAMVTPLPSSNPDALLYPGALTTYVPLSATRSSS